MPRPTKWDREVADAVWAKLQELADANGQTSPRAFVAAVRKDATALVEALIEDAIKHHEASADDEPWDDDAVLAPEVERQIAEANRNDDLALRDNGMLIKQWLLSAHADHEDDDTTEGVADLASQLEELCSHYAAEYGLRIYY